MQESPDADSSNQEMPTEDECDEKLMEPSPSRVQNVETMSQKGREAANNKHSLKHERSKIAEPREPSLVCSAERKIIVHALADGHDDDIIAQQVGSSCYNVTRRAMQSLRPGQWVKDEVINSFFHLLSQRDGEICSNNAT